MAGVIGRTVMSGSNNATILPRLTGLDPAGPGFFPPTDFYPHLSDKDAKFVDIIHTDAGGYGQSSSTGSADFWPNGGRNQTGCSNSMPASK